VALDAFASPVAQGVFLGLLFGKPFGIAVLTLATVRLCLCEMRVTTSLESNVSVA
jgi:Na+/H+ antiporter NhaA